MDILINIDVDDVPKATAFYTVAFGLRVGRRFGDDGVELLGGASRMYLLRKEAATSPFPESPAGRDYTRHWSPVHLDFVVDALEPAVERALRCGARQEGEVREAIWGRIATLSDPFGHGFCLIQFLNRGYDEITTQDEPPPGGA